MAGVIILELCRAPISECGVEPSRIVNLIDAAWKVGGDVGEDLLVHQVDRLGVFMQLSASALS